LFTKLRRCRLALQTPKTRKVSLSGPRTSTFRWCRFARSGCKMTNVSWFT